MKLVEKIGSGIPRMKELMLAHGLPEPEYNMDGMFSITLRRSATEAKMSEKMSEKMSGLLFELISKNKYLTIKELAEKTGKTTRTVERYLKILKSSGKLKRSGQAKGGYWIIISN